MKGARIYLKHIAGCIVLIELLAKEGRDAFFNERKSRDAILRNLQVHAAIVNILAEEDKNN